MRLSGAIPLQSQVGVESRRDGMKKRGRSSHNRKVRSEDSSEASCRLATASGTDGLIACPTLRRLGNHRRFKTEGVRLPKAHSFASPSFDGFALSRMKGVLNPRETLRSAPVTAAKTGNTVCSIKSRSNIHKYKWRLRKRLKSDPMSF